MEKIDLIQWIIFGIAFLIESLIQILGSIYYKESLTPSWDWVWLTANALIFFIPLLEGMIKGLIFLIPIMISEALWYIKKGYIGAILHAVAFLICGLILGAAFILINKFIKRIEIKIIISSVLFEAFQLIEEILYYFMRKIFMNKKSEMTWKNISVTFISIPNPVLLVILIILMVILNKIETSNSEDNISKKINEMSDEDLEARDTKDDKDD